VSFEGQAESDAPLKGKLRYFAPEQLLGKEADQRVDIYDLGVTLWEMCSGARAFAHADDKQTTQIIINNGLVPVRKLRRDLPKELSHAIDLAVARDPSDRFETAANLYRALRHLESYTAEQVAEAVARVRAVAPEGR
jgi:serine/threonine-protein kinase